MFFRKKKQECVEPFDRENRCPVIRASICTGEKVAGFRNLSDGRFEEVTVIRDDSDLRDFLRRYGIKESELKKEW